MWGTSDLMLVVYTLVSFLATRILYQGGTSELRSVVCTLVQFFLRSVLSTFIPFLAHVSCIYVSTILHHLMPLPGGTSELGTSDCKCQCDLTSDCKCQADLSQYWSWSLDASTRRVHLTWECVCKCQGDLMSYCKCQADLSQYWSWSLDVSIGGYIWAGNICKCQGDHMSDCTYQADLM